VGAWRAVLLTPPGTHDVSPRKQSLWPRAKLADEDSALSHSRAFNAMSVPLLQ
jgi:hypothetical protein